MPATSKTTTKKDTNTNRKNVPANGATSSNLADSYDTSDKVVGLPGGKPDKNKYDEEQTRIKTEIDALQTKLSAVRDKISLATNKSGPGNERRNTLRAELDSIRERQMSNRASRGKIIDQIKSLQEGIQKKVKDLQASKSKIPYKTVADLDAHVKNLEKQVESGSMKLAEEKRALQDISSARRSRRVLEGYQAEHDTVEKDKATIDQLREQLDDPESKAVSDRFDAIKAELDELKKESDEAYAGRNKLFEERDTIQKDLNVLFTEKRESVQRYRDANDQYRAKIDEERARRAERLRQQRATEEAQKKKEVAERLLEEAQIPAYQAQVEDCQTLVDYFSGKSSSTVTLTPGLPPLAAKTELAGVPKLEIRKVEDTADGLVAMKKKGEEEQTYFVGKAKGKKGSRTDSTASTPTSTPSNGLLNIPLSNLSALLTLSIPPPASSADLPRVVEDLKTKKAWFEANQARQTAENIAKAQAQIQKLNSKEGLNGNTHIERVSTPSDGATSGSTAIVDQA